MNVEIGTEDMQFPEKGYINDIFAAVYLTIRIAYGGGGGGLHGGFLFTKAGDTEGCVD
jgi:hypothetical protein